MEDLLPFYIYNGVSKAEFMDSEPRELECYDLAYKFSEGRRISTNICRACTL